MAKLALTMIVAPRDQEAAELDRCLKSIYQHVDGIFITITGKNKKVTKVAKKYGAHISYCKWEGDFAKARNFNLSQVPKEYEYTMWLDVDDVVHGAENIRREIESAKKNNIHQVFADYLYEVFLHPTMICDQCAIRKEHNLYGLHNAVSEVLITHKRERLTRNDGTHKWIGEIHETLIEQTPTTKIDTNSFQVIHLAALDDRISAVDRNIEILEKKLIDENAKDPRTIFYLGKSYFDLHEDKLDEYVLMLMKEYLKMSGWHEERVSAWEYINQIHRKYHQYDKAIDALFMALDEDHRFPSVYTNLAYTYMMMGKWQAALHWVKIAAQTPIPKTTVIINPFDLRVRLLEITFMASINLRNIEEAYAAATELVKMLPDNDWAKQRFAMITEVRESNALANSVARIANYYLRTNQLEPVRNLVAIIPPAVANEPALMDLRNRVMPPKVWRENDIAIYCGPGFEQWSPLSINEGGLGGSETAVVFMARELSALGWNVTVFADPGAAQGRHDGVTYLPYYHFNSQDSFNILISWRQPGLFDLQIKAKQTYVWCHDVLNPMDFTKQRLEKIDRVIVLSQAHWDTARTIPEDKVYISTNGIHL